MAEIANNGVFSQTDASNNGSLPGISGSSAPSQIDDSIRALIGAVKREHDWRNFTVTSTGSSNAYVLTYSVAPAAYYTGQAFGFKTNFAVTGAATVNVNTLGAKTIKKLVSGAKTDLASGDISSGDYIAVVYDGTDMVWVNKGVSVSAASDTASGIVELATTTETLTGTDTARAVTPDALAALWEQGSDVASAGTISLGEGGYFNITGTTTITDIDLGTDKAGRKVRLKFAGTLTLTHNGTTLILPSGLDISTEAGDIATFVSEGSDVVRCVDYMRATGVPLRGRYKLGTLTTTSGTTQPFTGIPLSKYMRIYLQLSNVSFTASATLQIALSTNDGSSYGTAVNIAPATGAAANGLYGVIEIDSLYSGYYGVAKSWLATAAGNAATHTSAILGDAGASGGPFNAFRLSGGTFDAGTIDVSGEV